MFQPHAGQWVIWAFCKQYPSCHSWWYSF